MSLPVTLPPLDGPFAAWLAMQPTLHQLVHFSLKNVQVALHGRTSSDFVRGRDAAQFIRSIADEAGFADVAQFYYTVYEWFCLRLIALV